MKARATTHRRRLRCRTTAAAAVHTVVVWLLLAGLCALCAVQWLREFALREQIADLTAETYWQQSELAGKQAQLDTWEAEIEALSGQLAEVRSGFAAQLAELTAERDDLAAKLAQVRAVEGVMDEAGERIEQANERIRRQNEAMAALSARIDEQQQAIDRIRTQRDDLARQLNERTEAYNALVRRVGDG